MENQPLFITDVLSKEWLFEALFRLAFSADVDVKHRSIQRNLGLRFIKPTKGK